MDKLVFCAGIKKGLIKTGVFCACILGAAFHFSSEISMVNAEDDVAIDATNFPNDGFRYMVKAKYDADNDDLLSEAERNAVTSMRISSTEQYDPEGFSMMAYTDLRGIEFFTQLESLEMSGTFIQTIDLNENQKLKRLSCDGLNWLREVDVSGNTDLEYLKLPTYHNNLVTLDVSNNSNLKELYCDSLTYGDGNLKSLILGDIRNLEILSCRNNQLKSLDISKCTKLKTLYCSGNRLQSLNIANNTALDTMMCNNNLLDSIDLSKNTSIYNLDCSYNNISELDLHNNNILNLINCAHNQIETITTGEGNKISILRCEDNKISTITPEDLPKIQYLYCWNNEFDSLDFGAVNTSINQNMHYIPESYDFTDIESYEAWGGKITVSSEDNKVFFISDLISINETNFPDSLFREYVEKTYDMDKDERLSKAERDAVTMMRVDNEGISDLAGVEHFTALEKLSCSNNYLSVLNLSGNIYLNDVDCSSNRLVNLDLSSNDYMKNIVCNDNQIAAIDLGSILMVEAISCNNNQLEELVIDNCTELKSLSCKNNKLTELDLDNNTALDSLYCNNNMISSLYVSKCAALTKMDCSNNELKKLNVSKNSELVSLYCDYNKLTSLVLNEKLKSLSCSNNELTMLDLTGYNNMNSLECYDNRITSIDTDAPLSINRLYCWGNDFDRIDITLKNSSTELFPTAPCDAYDSYTNWGKNIIYDSENGALIVTEAEEQTKEEEHEKDEEQTDSGKTEESITDGNIDGSSTGKEAAVGNDDTADKDKRDESTVDSGQAVDDQTSGNESIAASGGQTMVTAKLDASITAKSFKKTLGNKSFKIGAVTNSDGTLTYASDNKNVVTISDSGKVKIAGCGRANITVTALETDTYKTASETVTVTVLPGKLKIKKIRSPKRSQISFSWSKMQGATEYQYSISETKSFNKAVKFSGKSTTVKKKAAGASGRKFYVRARAVVKIDGKKYYGKWSSTKSVTVK